MTFAESRLYYRKTWRVKVDSRTILEKAKEVLSIEIEGLETVRQNLDENFVKLVEACCKALDAGGKIVISGLGKSGHVGSKIAATMASTGSPTIFMHPVEAMHGDLGMLQEHDLLLALSYSGESDELVRVLVPAKRLGVTIAAITGNPASSLAKLADLTVPQTVPNYPYDAAVGQVETEVNPDSLYVVAFVANIDETPVDNINYDRDNIRVYNAAKCDLGNNSTTGIATRHATTGPAVTADGGRITVDGEDHGFDIYSLSGQAMANGSLGRGIYIVRFTHDGRPVCRKVIVK